MRRIRPDNINTKEFWNDCFKPEGREDYYHNVWTLEPSGRFPFLAGLVEEKDKVLDVGCGMGHFTRMVKEEHPLSEVWGTDISDLMIADNRKMCPLNKYFVQRVEDQGDIPSGYFDKVFCGEVIEHLNDPNTVFTEALRVLKGQGTLVVTTPNDSYGELSEEHLWTFTYHDILDLFAKHGFIHLQILHLPKDTHDQIIVATGVKDEQFKG